MVKGDGHLDGRKGGRGDAAFSEIGVHKNKNRRAVTRSNHTLLKTFKEIAQMADRLNLPRTTQYQANHVFKIAHDGKKSKTPERSTATYASASLYIACRQEGVPRTFKEICAVSKMPKKNITRCFKLILKVLDTSVDLIPTGDFISRFCATLTLPISVVKAATCIAKAAVDLNIVSGRSPISVAASAIYMASQASEHKRQQKEIGVVAGVADITIRQSYKLMYPRAEELFPKNFTFFTKIELLPLD